MLAVHGTQVCQKYNFNLIYSICVGLYPKIGMLIGTSAFMYYYGRYRAYNFASRDAVIDHYMELHPDDFERTGDCKETRFNRKWI